MTEDKFTLKAIADQSSFILNATTADLFNAFIVAFARMGTHDGETAQAALEMIVRKLMREPQVADELRQILKTQGDLAFAQTKAFLSTGENEAGDVSMIAVVIAATIFEAWPMTNRLAYAMFKSIFAETTAVPVLVGLAAMFDPQINGPLSAFTRGGAQVWFALLEHRERLCEEFVRLMAETAEEVRMKTSGLVLTDQPSTPQ